MKNVLIRWSRIYRASFNLLFIKKYKLNIISLDRLDYSGNLNRLDNILSKLKNDQKVKG